MENQSYVKYQKSKEELYIKRIQDKYRELGRPPKQRDVKNGCNISTYFDGWRNALKASNIPVIEKISAKSDEELLELIRIEAKKLGRTPISTEVPHYSVIQRRFGTWNNALIRAGFDINKVKNCKYTKEQITDMLIQYYNKYNKIPTKHDVNISKEVDANWETIVKIFKMEWNDILKSIGLKRNVEHKEIVELKKTLKDECDEKKKILSKNDLRILYDKGLIPSTHSLLEIFKVKNTEELFYKILTE